MLYTSNFVSTCCIMADIKVLFPEPDLPVNAVMAPRGSENVTPSTNSRFELEVGAAVFDNKLILLFLDGLTYMEIGPTTMSCCFSVVAFFAG